MSAMKRGQRLSTASREVEQVGLSSTKHQEKSKAPTVSTKCMFVYYFICLFILDRRERKRMGELVEAYKRLKKILPNSENIKSKRSILEQVRG